MTPSTPIGEKAYLGVNETVMQQRTLFLLASVTGVSQIPFSHYVTVLVLRTVDKVLLDRGFRQLVVIWPLAMNNIRDSKLNYKWSMR